MLLQYWKEKFRRLKANIPGMVYQFAMHPDNTYSFPYVNGASLELFALTPGEIMGDANRITMLIHPDDRERFDDALSRSAKTLDPWRQEIRHIVNGEVRWYDWTSRPGKQANGDIIWDGIVLESTDRKRTEGVIEARLRLLQFAETHTMDELLEATLDEAEAVTDSLIGFYVFLLEDQKTLSLQNWSTRTKRDYCKAEGKGFHYGISQAGVWVDCVHQRKPVIHNDYASLPHRKGLPADHAPLVRELVAPVFRGEKIVAILAVGNKPTDYTSRDVESVSLLADLAWTIVERKNSQVALRESEEKFMVFAETTPTAIIVYQGERIVYVNSAATCLFGYCENKLLQMNFWEWAVDECRQLIRDRGMARQRGEELPGRYEQRFVNREGKTGWVMVSAGTIEFGGKPACIAMFNDISEAKQAEERLKASLAEKEILLKEVHHRVKNNLQIISSLLYLQSQSIPDDRSRGYLRESQNRVRSMALIHERLYGSKNFSSIDFGDYIRDLSQFLFNSYTADSARISLQVVSAEGTLGINEAIPCGLIVNELLSNSLKHAFPGDRSGEISIHMGKNTDGWINITVADTGIGLPPGLDFERTETLGLQLVSTLVRQLRGRMTIGEQKRGASISISFPGNGPAGNAG